jgi:hypothetical protein
MSGHPQIESLLKQLKARSMVIVYQILRHSLLRCALQKRGQPPSRRGGRRSPVSIRQATHGSGTVFVIVQNHAAGGWVPFLV